MPVTFIPKDSQIESLAQYNKDKKRFEQIPNFPRNEHSGWPLLQVSLYSPDFSGGNLKYSPALAGGKCHYVYLGAFFLAKMLTELPGKVEAPEQFSGENIGSFLDRFKVHHKTYGIGITQTSGPYGKMLNVLLPVETKLKNTFSSHLGQTFSYALKKVNLHDVGNWHETSYTKEQIESSIDTDVAIFRDGQIYIDFGAFLDKAIKDDEIKDYFSNIFQVEAFNSLEMTAPKIQATPIDDLATVTIQNDHEVKSTKNTMLTPNQQRFYQHLGQLKEKARDLEQRGFSKEAKSAEGLANTLELAANDLVKQPSNENYLEFTRIANDAIEKEKPLLAKHRGWKQVLGNTALAIVGFGFGYLAVGLAHKAWTGNFLFFKTDSEEKIDTIKNDIAMLNSF
jgi:hypothetical protein